MMVALASATLGVTMISWVVAVCWVLDCEEQWLRSMEAEYAAIWERQIEAAKAEAERMSVAFKEFFE